MRFIAETGSMAVDLSWRTAFKPGASDDFFRTGRPVDFDVDAVGFSPANAWWLAELSRLIYKQDATEGVVAPLARTDFLARVGLVERRFFNHPHLQAALVETEAVSNTPFTALVFRGTAGRLSNWLFNLDMASYPWPAGGKVHRGFGRLIRAAWEPIAADLETVTTPLFYTGHSLGGALALLAASLLPPRAVYTFGAPRIGDAAFAESLSKVAVFNVINARDIVTQLPPAGHRTRFAHAGIKIRNIDLLPDNPPFIHAPAFIADHAPLNYTAQLPMALDN
jgi:triacylglycerol lipase